MLWRLLLRSFDCYNGHHIRSTVRLLVTLASKEEWVQRLHEHGVDSPWVSVNEIEKFVLQNNSVSHQISMLRLRLCLGFFFIRITF